jgi:hypothetical protein
MTPVQVFDALNGKSFSYIECKGGSKFGGTLLKVNFYSDEGLEPACIEVTPDGLLLHFNSDDGSGFNKRGETVWLDDIVTVG